LSASARREELLLLGLRLANGIERSRFYALTGLSLEQAVDPRGLERVREIVILDHHGLRVTPAGRLLLDTVLRELLIPDRVDQPSLPIIASFPV
jgi:oxygen-independent coproporphyrinogen-3 oxidase